MKVDVTSLCVALLFLAASPVAGQEGSTIQFQYDGEPLRITLAEARAVALAGNRELIAERASLQTARGEVIDAATLPHNPELEYESAQPDGPLGFGRYEARLAQTVEIGGQRGVRRAAAERDFASRMSAVADAERKVIARVSRAFYTVAAADQQRTVALRIDEQYRELDTATRTQLEEGEISVLEANVARIESGQSQARLARAERVARAARAELALALGEPGDREIILEGPTPPAPAAASLDAEALVAQALLRRPDLRAATERVDAANQRLRLARRALLPDVQVALITQREELPGTADGVSGAEQSFGVGVALPIPLFNSGRGQRAIRTGERNEAEALSAALHLQICTEVVMALEAYEATERELALFEDRVRGPVEQNQAMLQTAYDAGKLDLPSLVVLRNQLYDAEFAFWDAWLEHRLALVDLRAAAADFPTADVEGGAR